jgi:DNA-directed RNA polymerase specialized sigma24 family protein
MIEAIIFAAEVLKHQVPEAQRATVLLGLPPAYTNAEAAAILRVPIGAVMTVRHSALKLGGVQARTLCSDDRSRY